MSKHKELYFQCELSQGTGRDVAYLEERGAVVGKTVEINPGSGDFWVVESVSSTGIDYVHLKDIQDGHHKGYASIKDQK